jgi:transposase
MRYELTDYEWAAIKPFLPNRPHEYRVERFIDANPALEGSLGRHRYEATYIEQLTSILAVFREAVNSGSN